jgi:hypothetical protein
MQIPIYNAGPTASCRGFLLRCGTSPPPLKSGLSKRHCCGTSSRDLSLVRQTGANQEHVLPFVQHGRVYLVPHRQGWPTGRCSHDLARCYSIGIPTRPRNPRAFRDVPFYRHAPSPVFQYASSPSLDIFSLRSTEWDYAQSAPKSQNTYERSYMCCCCKVVRKDLK